MFHEDAKIAGSINSRNVFFSSMISGGVAGTVCDLTFFPLDTLKTRLQSQHGFNQSGGFRRLYQGVIPVMVGSAPAASLFFITYEGIKEFAQPKIPQTYHLFIHMGAASLGEMVACLVRVPVEVMKQRKQALLQDKGKLKLRTLYRGYGSTVLRDLPFGLIQMPLWEYFKLCWKRQACRDCTPLEGAICGAGSVAVAAVITTPLDVAKTRIMLSDTSAEKDEVKISTMLKEVYREKGAKGLFAGFAPRVFGFTLGGFVFFGVYEQVKATCSTIFPYTSIPSS
ncbi:mitochondrial S-adenosylmethionine carrier protein [Neodiprion pinetum]|uniref:S-adenosylmethionine mitochondrial carrier protein n=1 Tax=Neodiprion lecontei TaxID=441921 RepID=A0A6J0BYP4_NEOLC|nr:S-adenosylmethionine mitochondrial carrier protein [Neodiprion lecontei]XP_046471664.1 S-adenosylmethionine mitochondrial carrier protein-like [Neodiprion pinetum]XP_046609182.1 S-adenosylmethionine mitochondrial carrier protein-like [Neodiprion virginianus]